MICNTRLNKVGCCLWLVMLSGLGMAEEANKLPNILIILADDLGYGDVGCYNEQAKVPTPKIDGLASEGMLFTDAHSPSTVCTPTRYGLLTGQMPFRVPNGGAVFTGIGGPSLIARERLTLAQLLSQRGYTTACVGKWHVGLTFFDREGQPIRGQGVEAVRQVDFSRRIEGGPIDHGFDSFFGTACCPTTDWLYAFIENDRVLEAPKAVLDKSKLPKHPYANDCRGGLIAPNFSLEDVDLDFLDKSRTFLERHVREAKGKPFFLLHATQAVHLPSFAARAFQGKSSAGPHGDFIVEFDHIVGELLATLERLSIADETIVILTSDNGPEVTSVVNMRADYDHDGARPWRGVKRDHWEGGHRVPFLVRWPGKVPANRSSSQLISLTDIMATLAAAVGAVLPDKAAEDSFNLLPAWLDADHPPIRPYLLTQAFGGQRTLAIRRGSWKFIDHPGSGGNRYENDPGLRPFILPEAAPEAPGQLYDLSSDPGETSNLYFREPKSAAELKALLEQSKASGYSRSLVALSSEHGALKRDIIYKTTQQGPLGLDLHYPVRRGLGDRYPLVLFTHGGGWTVGSKEIGERGVRFRGVSALTARGFCVASVDYRLWTEGGETVIRDCVTDSKDALRFLAKHAERFSLDSRRFFTFGDSAGGHLAQMLLLSPPESFAGVPALADAQYRLLGGVSWYGPCDFEKTSLFNPQGRSDFPDRFGLRILGGEMAEADRLAAYREVSPVNYLRAGSPPLLMVQGDRDTTIPVHHALYMQERAAEVKAPVELLIVENAGHNWREAGGELRPSFDEIIARTVDFMEQQLEKADSP